MPVLTVIMAGDNCWPDLKDNPKLVHLGEGAKPLQVAILDGGMSTGRPSISIRADLPDGTIVIAETSARLFCGAARMILAKYPNLFEGD
jgi:hypothetical protein